MGGPKQKGIIQYGQSPFRQSPMRNAFRDYVFNGYRRIASQVPYFAIPIALGYGVYSWGKARYQFLNSKAGHVAAMKSGGEGH